MTKSVKAPATPAVLRWARETSSMEIEDVAARFPSRAITAERIANWESDASEEVPTLAQLKELSRIYRRPLAVFFLQEEPREFPVPRDFRRVPGRPRNLSPALRFELRAAEERRVAALRFYEELDDVPPRFDLSGTLHEAPHHVAARMRTALAITTREQLAWPNHYEALRSWKTSIEALGVLVFQIPGIETSEMRGFSIAELPLPVIGINRGESPSARIFSMMHELTHLAVRQSSICDFNEDDDSPPEERRVEVFCNAVAAEILVPSEVFLMQPELIAAPSSATEWAEENITSLARRFKVSRTFVVRRLLEHGRVTRAYYRQKEADYLRLFQERRATAAVAPERWGEKRQRILGDAFTGLVIETYRAGHLTLSELLGHLQIKTKHLPQLEARFGMI